MRTYNLTIIFYKNLGSLNMLEHAIFSIKIIYANSNFISNQIKLFLNIFTWAIE